MVVRKRNFKKSEIKEQNKKTKAKMTRKIYNIVVLLNKEKFVIVVPLETTTQSYKEITWSKYGNENILFQC